MTQPELDLACKACGHDGDVRKIGQGLWSDVYDLGNDTVLKLVHRDGGIGDGLDLWKAECDALLALETAELAIAVPELLDSDSYGAGSPAVEAGFAAWMHLTRVVGKPLDDDRIMAMNTPTRDRLAVDLGEVLAVLHGAGDSLVMPDAQRLDDLEELDEIAKATADIAPDNLIDAIREAIEELVVDPGNVPSHGDINTTNLMVDDNGHLTGLVDWAEARHDWREGEMCHLMQIPSFFPTVRRAYEERSGIRLDDERLNLAAWHNLLISLTIARQNGDAEEEAQALEWAAKLPRPQNS